MSPTTAVTSGPAASHTEIHTPAAPSDAAMRVTTRGDADDHE
jgi:hypothetical protein